MLTKKKNQLFTDNFRSTFCNLQNIFHRKLSGDSYYSGKKKEKKKNGVFEREKNARRYETNGFFAPLRIAKSFEIYKSRLGVVLQLFNSFCFTEIQDFKTLHERA